MVVVGEILISHPGFFFNAYIAYINLLKATPFVVMQYFLVMVHFQETTESNITN